MLCASKDRPSAIDFRNEASVNAFKDAKVGALVCIFHVQRKPLGPGKEQLEFQATVIHNLKGGLEIGQKILCSKPIDAGANAKLEAGDLRFVFTDRLGDPNEPIRINDGDFPEYSEALLTLLKMSRAE